MQRHRRVSHCIAVFPVPRTSVASLYLGRDPLRISLAPQLPPCARFQHVCRAKHRYESCSGLAWRYAFGDCSQEARWTLLHAHPAFQLVGKGIAGLLVMTRFMKALMCAAARVQLQQHRIHLTSGFDGRLASCISEHPMASQPALG